MHVPIDAEVHCTDGLGGHTTGVILNPIAEKITHIVVKEKHMPHIQRLVPVELIAESSPHRIYLRCTTSKMAKMDNFIAAELIESEIPGYVGDPYPMRGHNRPTVSAAKSILLEHELVPPGEMSFHRGTQVEAIDGHIGRVDEFLVDPQTGQITHVILREGHLWGHKDVSIPFSEIQHFEEDVVFLKLDKQGVEALPESKSSGQNPDRELERSQGNG